MKRFLGFLVGVSLLGLGLSGCAGQAKAQEGLKASGTISADFVSISAAMNEKVLEVYVREGQAVEQGATLFVQDDSLLQAQHEQAAAQAAAADAGLQAAEAQLASAQAQYDVLLQSLRLQDSQQRMAAWQGEPVEEVNLPSWYFQKAEDLAAAQAEEAKAGAALQKEQANLEKVLQMASNDDFVAAEQRLAEAGKTYQALSETLEQARTARDNAEVEEAAQDQLEAAQTELNAARLAYERMLSSAAAGDVREARARLAVAQARLDYARAQTSRLQTSDDSLQLRASQAQVKQAETAVSQARANQAQAQAALRMIELQLGRAAVTAPVSGVILARNIEPGEFAAAGGVVMTIGQLDQVRLVVYVPEDEYGSLRLEQPARVSVDSYPGRTFEGQVVRIADQAEFTPRNVSTSEGRKSTVYAVEILLDNLDQALKPGMPAQVEFEG